MQQIELCNLLQSAYMEKMVFLAIVQKRSAILANLDTNWSD